MSRLHPVYWSILILMLGLVVGSCGTASNGDPQVSPLAQLSPLSTVASSPVPAATPTAVATPTLVPTPTPATSQLVVLHTNDNWGETEPCG